MGVGESRLAFTVFGTVIFGVDGVCVFEDGMQAELVGG